MTRLILGITLLLIPTVARADQLWETGKHSPCEQVTEALGEWIYMLDVDYDDIFIERFLWRKRHPFERPIFDFLVDDGDGAAERWEHHRQLYFKGMYKIWEAKECYQDGINCVPQIPRSLESEKLVWDRIKMWKFCEMEFYYAGTLRRIQCESDMKKAKEEPDNELAQNLANWTCDEEYDKRQCAGWKATMEDEELSVVSRDAAARKYVRWCGG